MLKFELRKLATIVLAVSVIGMMAACSGSSSSTDEALSHPGSNYLGSLRFDVDPQAESVEVTPVGSPFTSNKIVGNNAGVIPNITISTLPQTGPNTCFLSSKQNNTSWARVTAVSCDLAHSYPTAANGTLAYVQASSTMTYRAPGDAAAGVGVVVANGNTYTLASGTTPSQTITVYVIQKRTANASDTNVNVQRYRTWNQGTGQFDFNTLVRWADPNRELYNVRIGPNSWTDPDVKTVNSARCTGAWSGCGVLDPAVTYVADGSADGPVTTGSWLQSGATHTVKYLNALHAGCGSITAHWTLQEATALPYKFWADLYGDSHLISPLTSDPFYDPLTGSWYLRTYKFGAGTSNPPEGAPATAMAPGEWFYLHYSIDYSGNNSVSPFDPVTPGGDRHVEDTGNVAAWGAGTNSAANYWGIFSVAFSVNFDPAVIELNASNANDGPGTGIAKFTTAKGTALTRIIDSLSGGTAMADGFDFAASATNVFSNKMGWFYSISNVFAAAAGFFPNPCGLKTNVFPLAEPCTAGDGYANVDLDIGRVPLRIRTTAVAGQGTYLHQSYDSSTIITYGLTQNNPYDSTLWLNDVQGPKSTNWPNWCSGVPGQSCAAPGQTNGERAYVCVQ